MATSLEQRTSRFDMRMTPTQRSEIERAAALRGMTLTQWSLDSLLESARRTIAEETTTRLSVEAFDTFRAALDEGMPEETRALLAKRPVWS